MDILIIGGTRFLGRHLVDAATRAGHKLTLFNRGQSNPDLYPHIEIITGDRMQPADLDTLRGRQWDAVIDTCGYYPRQLRMMAETLKGAVDQYIFISSISVYADFAQPDIDETYPVGTIEDETIEEITNESYGPLKALCEQAVDEVLPGKGLHVRSGLIVGPYDPTDRFTYWPVRIERGGAMVAPDCPNCPTQFIDARDQSEWIIRMVEAGTTGVFNVTGPESPISLSHFFDSCQRTLNADVHIEWIDEQFLLDQEVAPWIGMPLWFPSTDPDSAGFARVNIDKALAHGLTFRSLTDTVQATVDWAHTRPDDHQWRAGITEEKESDVLRAWEAHQRG